MCGGPGQKRLGYAYRYRASGKIRHYFTTNDVYSTVPLQLMSRIHLVNPSTKSFGVAVITPRWLYVLASATGTRWGDPLIADETLEQFDFDTITPGDVVGIG